MKNDDENIVRIEDGMIYVQPSRLRGKTTKLTEEEIDRQIELLRNEWERNVTDNHEDNLQTRP